MTWCWCWKITRKDGLTLGFTTFNRDLVIGGLTYTSRSGFTPTATEADSTLNVNNLSVESIFQDTLVSEMDLIKGRYDNARIDIFWADWSNPSTQVPLLTGTMGEISNDGERWSAGLVSLSQKLAQKRLSITSKNCRHQFGDSKCTKSKLTILTSISQVVSAHSFKVVAPLTADLHAFGEVEFMNGDNRTLISTISTNTIDTVTVFEKPLIALQVGDQVKLTSGCRLTRRDCWLKHDNLINYGGQYWLRDQDFLISGPS
jgi:uncharacterized phage protein (TIGR02218 family)